MTGSNRRTWGTRLTGPKQMFPDVDLSSFPSSASPIVCLPVDLNLPDEIVGVFVFNFEERKCNVIL